MNKIYGYSYKFWQQFLEAVMFYNENINRNVMVWGEGLVLEMSSVILLYIYRMR